jgi:hypothetical protein
MPLKDKDCRRDVEQELHSLERELDVMDTWNRRFGPTELNTDSYLARQRRRWEIAFRIKELEDQSRSA